MSRFDDPLQEQKAVDLDIDGEEESSRWRLLEGCDFDDDGRWHARQRATQLWLAMSKEERMPRTQRELAKLLNVNEMTISRWKKLAGFQEEVTAIARTFLVVDLPEIYAALRKEAKAGSLPHIKVVLDLTGELRSGGSRAGEFGTSESGQFERTAHDGDLSEGIMQQIAKVYGTAVN